jgi:hypothetical protein
MPAVAGNDRLRADTPLNEVDEHAEPFEPVGTIGWDEPMPFRDVDVPTFPVDMLPPWIATWAQEQATAIQVPPDLPALLALAVVSLASSKKVSVEIKPGWCEPTNVYVAVALAPGLGKSPVFTAATAPVRQWERDERARLGPTMADANERAKTRDERAKTLRRKAACARSAAERANIESELRELAVLEADAAVPVPPRLIADDATPEAVGRLLAEQRGRLGVFSSEGGPFKILAGRYSEGRVNCELFCKAHSGDAYDLDRIGRPSIHLSAPLLTIGLTVQPEVIAGLASTPEFRSLGLLARFLYAIPRSNLGRRHPDPPAMSDTARDEYAARVRGLLELKGEPMQDGEVIPRRVPLEAAAYRALVTFKAALEPRLGPAGDLSPFADWGNKLTGTVARLAGLLHVADHGADDALHRAIPIETMDRAVAIGRYATEHARAAFGLMGADPTTNLAKVIWAWVTRASQGIVTKHEIHRAMQARVNRAAELEPAVGVLVERGLLREVHVSGPRSRGRPSTTFAVNPRARG